MSGFEHSAHAHVGAHPSEGAHTGAGVRSEVQPPVSNTGAEITSHWLRGGFGGAVEDVLTLTQELLPDSYQESLDWGRFMYKRQHVLSHGIRIYFEPATLNMPPVLVDCPGEACDVLGRERLQVLFCNSQLTRHDIAFDHAPFSPRQVATWVREGNIRCRAQKRKFNEDLGNNQDGETVYIGSRQSSQLLRVYDARGFTRVELELKGNMARESLQLLLAPAEEFIAKSVGVLREFVDFVDTSVDQNVSRAPLILLWSDFTQQLERAKIRVSEVVDHTIEQVQEWLEKQVSAMLFTFAKAGGSVGELIKLGRTRTKKKHRLLIARHNLNRAILGTA